jgi:two-component system response regulator MprA
VGDVVPAQETQPRRGEARAGVDVLVVDDDAAVRRLVRATLLDDGLSVATAADGREALEAIAGYAPRVVIVDLEMPVMNGRELIAALREQPGQPGIVILSAHGARRAGRELHVDATLEKPFDPQDLLDQVRRAGLE